MTYNLPLPYKSQAKKRKSDALMTLNVYRNLHFQSLNGFKKGYGDHIRKALPDQVPSWSCISITYVLHMEPTKGKPTRADPYRGSGPKQIDLTNLLSMVDKVNQDVLVGEGVIPEDTIKHVQEVSFSVRPYAETSFIEVIVAEIPPQPDKRKDS